MPGSMYFLGFAISCAIIPLMSDKIGRKKPFSLSLLIQTIMYFVIFFTKNIYTTIGCYFIIGMCSGGIVPIGLTYLNEFLPESK